MAEGVLAKGDEVATIVDAERRAAISLKPLSNALATRSTTPSFR